MSGVFNISPRLPFLKVLADYILNTAKNENINIADDIVLLPTRRSCRHLKEEFLKLNDFKSIMLPKIIPLGDVDEDEISIIDFENNDLFDDLPPAISGVERTLVLSKLIKESNYLDNSKQNITDEQIYSLADNLTHLMDTVEMEELDFKNLSSIVPDEYAANWQGTLKFLKIITDIYPQFLKTIGKMNPVEKKVKLIKKQVDVWNNKKQKGRIFAAGSTGSMVPISYMLQNIAKMENGFLILSGLDKNLTKNDIDFLTSTNNLNQNHPQYNIVNLISKLNLMPVDIPELPLFKNYEVANSDRELLATKIMAQSDMDNNLTIKQKFTNDILDGVSIVKSYKQQDESFAISCFLRTVIAENKTAMLITPDKNLAKFVKADLLKWNIKVDDSAGIKGIDTITGNYLILVLKMIKQNFSPYNLLEVLKHPYTKLGYNKEILNSLVTDLETVLRKIYEPQNLLEIINKSFEYPTVQEMLRKLGNLTNEFDSILKDKNSYHLQELLTKHIKLIENFVFENENTDVTETLYNTDYDSQLSEQLSDVLNEIANVEKEYKQMPIDLISGSSYFSFIIKLLNSLSLRSREKLNPNIIITNSIEARLLSADYYIMAGLNEGIFPKQTAEDPWMNRAMKKEFKLPLPEKKIGLSGHDFTEFFCKPNVILTYSETIDGKPVLEARWLNKLDAIININNIFFENPLEKKVKSWKDYFYNKPAKIFKPARFNPNGNKVFPDELYATSIERWYQDPYTVFAKYILNVEKLDEINKTKGSDFGNVIHKGIKIFEEQKKSTTEELYNIFIQRSLDFANLISFNFWKIKFKDIAKYYIDFKNSVKDKIKKTYVEVKGSWKIPNTHFTVSAIADRIDILNDDTAIIYDFKTGTFPSKKEVANGYFPQLLIEALILQKGGFEDIKLTKVSKIKYIKLSLLASSEIRDAIDSDISLDDLLKDTEKNLITAVKLFKNSNQDYVSYPDPDVVGDNIKKYSDYNHLARVEDWLVLDKE